ncbi:MAG: Druantia anti-phage system protein DruA [Paludibacter sp.]
MIADDKIIVNGRILAEEDIRQIIEITKIYWRLSYKELVKTICVNLRWASLVDTKKQEAIEQFLQTLEERKIIKLPTKRVPGNWSKHGVNNTFKRRNKIILTDRTAPFEQVAGIINDYSPCTVKLVSSVEEEELFNEYIERHHELKYGSPFGDRLKYFISIGGESPQFVGCIMFSASAWALEKRDKWIGWGKEDRASRLHLVVNNTRFLIFPWIKIKNLASWSLGEVAKRIQKDWYRKHMYIPVLLETFVDVEKYKGTCYKAANWSYIGNTKGRGRQDVSNKNLSSPKAIYMYPLIEDFRDYLTGKKTGGDCK